MTRQLLFVILEANLIFFIMSVCIYIHTYIYISLEEGFSASVLTDIEKDNYFL